MQISFFLFIFQLACISNTFYRLYVKHWYGPIYTCLKIEAQQTYMKL